MFKSPLADFTSAAGTAACLTNELYPVRSSSAPAPDRHARKEQRAADGLATAGRAHALGRNLDIAILACGATDEVGKHGVAVALPPGDLGSSFESAVAAKWPGTSTFGCRTGVAQAARTSDRAKMIGVRMDVILVMNVRRVVGKPSPFGWDWVMPAGASTRARRGTSRRTRAAGRRRRSGPCGAARRP